MQYMLLIYFEEQSIDEAERARCYADSTEFARQLSADGKFLGAAPLHPVSTATCVRAHNGKRMITDGPFAETREQLGGFFLVNARDLDEALDIASRVPAGRYGTVEVRPVIGIPDVADGSFFQPLDIAATPSTR